MPVISTTNPSSITDSYQTYYSKQLLDYAVQGLRKAEFAQTAPLPKNVGGKTIRFFRFGEPSIDPAGDGSEGIQTLTEGTVLEKSTYRELTMATVDATLVQIGQVIAVTDILNATSLLNIMSQAVKTNGEDAALKMDTLIRNELVADGTSSESDSRTKKYGGGVTTLSALAGVADSAGAIAATDLLDSVTQLKINRAPQISGKYVMISPPQVTRDLMNDSDWLEAHKYSAVQELFKGEVGSFHGVRVIEDTNPYIEGGTTKGTYNAAGDMFTSVVLGNQAFGVPALAGDSPKTPSVMIVDKADKSDPLNQTTTIGWKAFYCAKALNTNWFIVLRNRSAYSHGGS